MPNVEISPVTPRAEVEETFYTAEITETTPRAEIEEAS